MNRSDNAVARFFGWASVIIVGAIWAYLAYRGITHFWQRHLLFRAAIDILVALFLVIVLRMLQTEYCWKHRHGLEWDGANNDYVCPVCEREAASLESIR